MSLFGESRAAIPQNHLINLLFIKMSKPVNNGYDDDITPSEPPPSYSEALNAPPVLPNRPLGPPPNSQQNLGQFTPNSSIPPSVPSRPLSGYQPSGTGLQPSNYSYQGSSSTGRTSYSLQTNSGSGSTNLYSNNPNLPFTYPRGHYCRKCQNTGFKQKNGKPCMDCWGLLYLNTHAYNPNPSLPFRYPKRFICEKCHNTGTKRKNGLTCQDCYARFAPRNNYQVQLSGLGFMDFVSPVSNYLPPGGGVPMRVPPGDPRLGGQLCGNCRGSGQVYFLLDRDLCPVCGGLGRLLNSGPPQQSGYYR